MVHHYPYHAFNAMAQVIPLAIYQRIGENDLCFDVDKNKFPDDFDFVTYNHALKMEYATLQALIAETMARFSEEETLMYEAYVKLHAEEIQAEIGEE